MCRSLCMFCGLVEGCLWISWGLSTGSFWLANSMFITPGFLTGFTAVLYTGFLFVLALFLVVFSTQFTGFIKTINLFQIKKVII